MLQLNDITISNITLSITGTKKDRLVMNIDDQNSITLVQPETEYFNINGTLYEKKGTRLAEAE